MPCVTWWTSLLWSLAALTRAQVHSPLKQNQALELIHENRPEEAHELFRETLEDNPSRPPFWQNLGLVLVGLADSYGPTERAKDYYYEAIECLRMAHELDPSLSEAVAPYLNKALHRLLALEDLPKQESSSDKQSDKIEKKKKKKEKKKKKKKKEEVGSETASCSGQDVQCPSSMLAKVEQDMDGLRRATKTKTITKQEREFRRGLFRLYRPDQGSMTLADAVKLACRTLSNITITPTKRDLRLGRFGALTLAEVFQVFKLCGVVVVKGAFDKKYITEDLWPATQVRVQEYLNLIALSPEATNRSGSNQRSPQRYEIKYPLEEPFIRTELIANRFVAGVSNMALGTHKYELDTFSHVTSLPHSPPQHWHRDVAALFETRNLELPAHGVVAFIPLHDVTQEMGPTRFAVGTHWQDPFLAEEIKKAANTWPVVDTPAEVGDFVLFDVRIAHMGGENLSDQRRTLVYLSYVQEWWMDKVNFVDKHTKDYDHYAPRVQELLARQDSKLYTQRLEAKLRELGVNISDFESEYGFYKKD